MIKRQQTKGTGLKKGTNGGTPSNQNTPTARSLKNAANVQKPVEQKQQAQNDMLSIQLDRHEYYENEALTGCIKMKLEKELRNIKIALTLTQMETYTLFDEGGQFVLANKQYKKNLVKQEMEGSTDEAYAPGEHHIQFGIRVPQKIENGTFYHCGETLNARISYRLKAKIFDKHLRGDGVDQEEGIRVYRTETFVKICNHFKTFTLQKQLYDEQTSSSFLCFGGGTTTVEVEFLRDTFCISHQKLSQSRDLNSSNPHNESSVRSLYMGEDEPLDPGENPDNVIEIRYQVDNTQNKMKVDEVLVQLIQVVSIKGLSLKKDAKNDEETEQDQRVDTQQETQQEANGTGPIRHIQEVLFEKRCQGIYPKDQTEQTRTVRISLSQINKSIIKRQQKGGDRYEKLPASEVKTSRGLQQTTTGTYVENFYMLRVKGVISKDPFHSPYVDAQIFLCCHDLPPLNLSESKLKEMEDAQTQFLMDLNPRDLQDGQAKIVDVSPEGLIELNTGQKFRSFHKEEEQAEVNQEQVRIEIEKNNRKSLKIQQIIDDVDDV